MMNSQNPLRISIKNIVILMGIVGGMNILTILISNLLQFESNLLFFIVNVVTTGFVFPYIMLYKQRAEKFMMTRYLRFVVLSIIAFGVVAYLFVIRF